LITLLRILVSLTIFQQLDRTTGGSCQSAILNDSLKPKGHSLSYLTHRIGNLDLN
jgi:hypothetical protein